MRLHLYSLLVLVALLLLLQPPLIDGLCAPIQNDRHVIFLSRYSGVAGPSFRELFHDVTGHSQQRDNALVGGPRVAFVPTASYAGTRHDPRLRDAARAEAEADAERLTRELDLERCELLELDAFDADPLGLEQWVRRLDPHVFWVGGGNTFFLRHFMRSSGFDSVVRERCGPGPERDAAVYVGVSAGAICGGASVATAYFKGLDDPALAPENPLRSFRGLGLVGAHLSCFPHFDAGQGHEDLVAVKRAEFGLGEEEGHRIATLKDAQAFVWTQRAVGVGCEASSDGGAVRSFTFNADQPGVLEDAWEPPPLPPC